MEVDNLIPKTSASLDEIKVRVANALQRHPLCRNVQFEIVRVSRTHNECNWTISLRSVESGGVWEASDIVRDIQDAYILTAAA